MSSAQWHTEARRQPTIIGKDAAGKPIKGGPYTLPQFVALLVTLVGSWATRQLWGGELTILSQLIIVAALSVAAVVMTGRIDFARSNPFHVAAGAVKGAASSLVRPGGTTVTARAFTLGKARPVRSTHLQVVPLIDLDDTAHDSPHPIAETMEPASVHRAASPADEVAAPDHSTPEPHPTPARQSALEAFLAAADRSHP